MSVLDAIEKLLREHEVKAILTDMYMVVPGYVFLVEWQNERYVLVNSKDLNVVIAKLQMDGDRTLNEHLNGVPVRENWQEISFVSKGIFQCALKVR